MKTKENIEKNASKSTALKSMEVAMSVDVERCAGVLDKNRSLSICLVYEGNQLLNRILESGIDEVLFPKLRDYVERCSSCKSEMYENRRLFTAALTAIQKKFIDEENAITPAQADTPAARINLHIRAFLQARLDAFQAAELRLQKNHEATERRILKRDDLNVDQKEASLQKADVRLLSGQKSLKEQAVKTEWLPVITATDGYPEVFKFWWEETGKFLPEADLQRIFHPMLSFARKQARKGIQVKGNGLEYKEVPVI